MRAMILAAGRGERMRPLTDTIPKPLLKINNTPLISYHIKNLAKIGVSELIINHAWLGEQIVDFLGDGADFGVSIQYSAEPEGGLETAGGVIKALPLLGDRPFLVVNADIWCDINFADISLPADKLAHLVLVPNPEHNPSGDFGFVDNQHLSFKANKRFTYSGVGIFHPDLFKNYPEGRLALKAIFQNWMPKNKITGQIHRGIWSDIGTVERLKLLQINNI